MFSKLRRVSLILAATGGLFSAAVAGPLTIRVDRTPVPPSESFHLGTSIRPDGSTLTVDRASLRLNGRPWIPAMGEFHFTRYPANEWREELLKMKAGGIDIVSTYVFWIHHEEIEGRFDWSGRRDLRRFVQLCADAGLKVVVRCGPWCHGEVRNGGLPDWVVRRFDGRARTTDEGFLRQVRGLYGEIARQLAGLLWKEGGPVVGVQLDNEYSGPAGYLLALKKIAREAGLDVPLYTRTGWPELKTPMPFGEILPLYGAYAEGFWDRELTSMPGQYWAAFRFSPQRLDANIANEQLGRRDPAVAAGVAQYPFLTCEMGGGMMSSYHRRILIAPADVESPVLVKLGSGSVLPGYYMYQGGTNPDGKLSTLMEAQDTPATNWNDLPVKNYDFQAPLGEFGQIRPQYHLLRRLHLFLHDFGPALAEMPAAFPDERPQGSDDTATLRWAVRSDGTSGFVFVNNYERSRTLPAKAGVQFAIGLPGRTPLVFPATPCTVAAGARFIWPFNLDLGHGVRLAWATAQPVGAIDDGAMRTVFFAETPGVPAQFALAGEAGARRAAAGRGAAWSVAGKDGTVRAVLLSEADSLALWKGAWRGRDRVLLTRAGVMFDGDTLRLTSRDPAELTVGIFPAPAGKSGATTDGVFARFAPAVTPAVGPVPAVAIESIQAAGPAREIPLGQIARPVAAEPNDADFAQAAVWRIKLPAGLDLAAEPLLRIRYVGDVARVTLNGRLLVDDFYNGNVFEVGLRRYAPEILSGDLRLAILPLRKDAPIFMAESARPKFGGAASVVTLKSVAIVPRYEARLTK